MYDADGPIGAFQKRWLTVAIDEVMYGTAPGTTVVLEEEGVSAAGPYTLNESVWLRNGDRALLFLTQGRGNTYFLTSSQGKFIQSMDSATQSEHHLTALGRELAALGFPQLLEDVRSGGQRASRENTPRAAPQMHD